MLNKKLPFFVSFLLLFALLISVLGCANMVKPQGGPRDVTPPVLLKATPQNMTRHFAAKTIQLDFDEYFKLNSQYTEITMSPVPDKQPEYKIKKRSLIINLKDTLQKNTTYVINFGKAIADINEGNVLKNFTYVFSTGEHIDSLSMSGNVINTLTDQREKDVTVMLFPRDKDSLYFGKKKPTIYTTTDTAGNFSLNNLHDGDYTIYALKQTANTKIYNINNKDLIAFLKKPITLSTDTSGIQLKLFKEEPIKFKVAEKKFDLDGKMFYVFNKRLTNPTAKVVYPSSLDASKTVEFVPTKDTAYIYMKNMAFDSIRVAFFDNAKPLDSVSLKKGKNEVFKAPLNFKLNISSDSKLSPFNNLNITASTLIDTFDPSLITLYEDSIPVNNLNLTRDTSNGRRFVIKYRWKSDAKYILSLGENAFTTIFGTKNKKFYKPFLVDKPENYSTLTLKVTVPDTAKSYILEFYQDSKNVLQKDVIGKNSTITYKNFLTGKYNFRVVYDDNKNGRWDSGNIKLKKYPEYIWIDQTQVTLRANWDAEEKLDIPKEPRTDD
jgi:hypothetical protein